MVSKMTGPPLRKSRQVWSKYPNEDLYSFIRNSEELFRNGHPRAIEVYKEYEPNRMNSFLELTNEDIDNIYLYIEN